MMDRRVLAGIAATSAALLMTELALTRIFSVIMFSHFAFLAISIALFGLSASGVLVYVARRRLTAPTRDLLWKAALAHAAATLVCITCLMQIRIEPEYSPDNAVALIAIYLLSSLPFFTGGLVLSLAFARLTAAINALYAADLVGAAAGCLALVPLLNLVGAPGTIVGAAALSCVACVCLAPPGSQRRAGGAAALLLAAPLAAQIAGADLFDVVYVKGFTTDKVLFSKWNSFSRVAVYDRQHHDWSLSPKFAGTRPPSLFMDIDAGASTPIVRLGGNLADAAYLRHELTAVAYHLAERPAGLSSLVIGPGGGRDVVTALVFGARRVDGVEINPIIVQDVMLDRFREYSGGLYADPRVSIHVEDGRSYVRRSSGRFDVIQASLVDTWAATSAGAFTLTENSLYTVEAFGDYLDHLTEDGLLTVTRWVADGLRLVTLAQAACAQRGLDAARHIAIVRQGGTVNVLLKRTAFTAAESARLQRLSADLGFTLLYAPGVATPQDPTRDRTWNAQPADYQDLVASPDPAAFVASHPLDIRATTDDRPFFFHVTRLRDQFDIGMLRKGPFGSGLSALFTVFAVSAGLVGLFVVGPLFLAAGRPGTGWSAWLGYFGALGAGFMLIEVALLQHLVLLLGHPVYSLTVTLFCLLLGTGLGSLASRRMPLESVRRFVSAALGAVALVAVATAFGLARVIEFAIAWPLAARVAVAAAVLLPLGVLLGVALPGGMRLLDRVHPQMVPWSWAMNGAFSVVGATLAIFIAMNWGFAVTLLTGAAVYLLAGVLLRRL